MGVGCLKRLVPKRFFFLSFAALISSLYIDTSLLPFFFFSFLFICFLFRFTSRIFFHLSLLYFPKSTRWRCAVSQIGGVVFLGLHLSCCLSLNHSILLLLLLLIRYEFELRCQ